MLQRRKKKWPTLSFSFFIFVPFFFGAIARISPHRRRLGVPQRADHLLVAGRHGRTKENSVKLGKLSGRPVSNAETDYNFKLPSFFLPSFKFPSVPSRLLNRFNKENSVKLGKTRGRHRMKFKLKRFTVNSVKQKADTE